MDFLNFAEKTIDDIPQSKIPEVITNLFQQGLGNIHEIIKRAYAPRFQFPNNKVANNSSHVGRNFNRRKLKLKKKKKARKQIKQGKGIGSLLLASLLPTVLTAAASPDD
jgi:hypothetical protein